MGLRTVIAADASSGGALLPLDAGGSADGFNTLVWFYPAGNAQKKVRVNVIVDEDGLPATNETWGDGRILNRNDGTRLRESVVIECPASLNVRRVQPDGPDKDYFEIETNEFWAVKRIIGRDAWMQSVLCIRSNTVSINSFMRSG